MTKRKQRETLRDLRAELARLAELEKAFDPSYGFMLRPYSKRRARLVRMFWAVKRGCVL